MSQPQYPESGDPGETGQTPPQPAVPPYPSAPGQYPPQGQYPPPPPGQYAGYPGGPQEGWGQPVEAPRRPATVVAGCVMAWIGGAVGILGGVVAATADENSALLDGVASANKSDYVSVLNVVGPIYALWCVAVVVFAYFAFRAAKWAALALLVMAAVVVLLSLLATITGGSVGGAPLLLWTFASAFLIYGAKSSKQWFAAHTSS